jgi:hypothetical protein
MENSNQPAYPRIYEFSSKLNNDFENEPGLTKREHIAAKALQGILAKSHRVDGMTEHEVKSMAADAIMFADELLKQLEG